MTVVLDSNILVELERGNPELIRKIKEISRLHKEKPYVTSLSIGEIMCGALKQNINKQLKILERFKNFNIVNTSFSSGILLANFKHILNKKGRKIPIIDLIIASIAIDNDLTIVTMDNHFKRIPGLDVIYLNQQ